MKQKKMLKRIFALSAAMLLAAAVVPTGFSAETVHAESSGTESQELSGEDCGEGLSWHYDGKGTLTISGEGAMKDWSFYPSRPWNSVGNIQKVVIEDGVTGIGDYAFYECRGLTEIEIPDSVTSIGYSAFYDCDGLTEIKIPDSVTSIGNQAFYSCSLLEVLTLGNGVEKAGNYAFYDCSKLMQVVIPQNLTELPEGMFSGCHELTRVKLNGQLKTIGSYAFEGCSSLQTMNIPAGVETIDTTSFHGCSGLREISVAPDSESFSSTEGVLFNKDASVLLQYPKGSDRTGYTVPEGVQEIGTSAFSGCSRLEEITLPDSLTGIGNGAFSSCSSLSEIQIPGRVTKIGNNAFKSCSKLEIAVIPDSVAAIGSGAFQSCPALVQITIPDSVTEIGAGAFSNCSAMGIMQIPGSVQTIPSDAFYGCSGLVRVTLKEGVTEIGSSAFQSCRNIKAIELPESMRTVGESAFRDCNGLETIKLNEGLTGIGSYAFTGCTKLGSITIPDSVKSLGSYVFQSCTSLDTAVLGAGLKEIGAYDFSGCTGLKSFTIPENIKKIGQYAFSNTGLTDIVIPYTVTGLGGSAFKYCSSLEKATIGSNNGEVMITGISSMQGETFYGCRNLQTVTIAESLQKISKSDFSGCSSLKEIHLPGSLVAILENAFSGCDSLAAVHYNGSEKDWSGNKIESGNDALEGKMIFADKEVHEMHKVDAVPATCAKEGHTTYYYCTNCNNYFSDPDGNFPTTLAKTVIKKLDHQWGEETIEKNATCTEKGISSKTCEKCGETSSEEIPLKAHTPQSITGTPATCRSTGLTAGEKCSVCGEILKEQTVIEKLDHTWDKGVVSRKASCGEAGEKLYTCTVCGETKTEEIPADGVHTEEAIPDTEATCAEAGHTGGTRCAVCGKILVEPKETEKKLNHTWDKGVVTREATCSEAGEKLYTCTVCKETKTEEIPVSGKHSWNDGEVTKAATCEEAGIRTFTCTVCGKTRTEEISSQKAHSVKTISGIPATCTEAGLTDGEECRLCGKILKEQEIIPATGHSYETVTTAATWKKDGSILVKCRQCGEVKSRTTVSQPKTASVKTKTYSCDGKAKKPSVVVKDSKGAVIGESNYSLQYSANVKPGKASVKITFKGKYTGTKTLTFTINPKTTAIASLKAARKGFTVTWKKQTLQTSGYQIQYSISPTFKSGSKTVKVKNNRTVKKKVTGLMAKKKYYVRVRTYKTVSGKTYYGAWSREKAVTTTRK